MSNNKKNFLGKFAGKGYYIALVLCAVAIGISGYLYYRNANGPHLEKSGGYGGCDESKRHWCVHNGAIHPAAPYEKAI